MSSSDTCNMQENTNLGWNKQLLISAHDQEMHLRYNFSPRPAAPSNMAAIGNLNGAVETISLTSSSNDEICITGRQMQIHNDIHVHYVSQEMLQCYVFSRGQMNSTCENLSHLPCVADTGCSWYLLKILPQWIAAPRHHLLPLEFQSDHVTHAYSWSSVDSQSSASFNWSNNKLLSSKLLKYSVWSLLLISARVWCWAWTWN